MYQPLLCEICKRLFKRLRRENRYSYWFSSGCQTQLKLKSFETINAVRDGADEIDMVINVTKLKDKDYGFIVDEIKGIKAACQGHNLKVIIETGFVN